MNRSQFASRLRFAHSSFSLGPVILNVIRLSRGLWNVKRERFEPTRLDVGKRGFQMDLALSVTDAPMRRRGIRTALWFFQTHMSTLPPSMALNFLLAMDLSREVNDITLHKGEEIIAFRNRSESEFKLFYTRSGASKHSSGINPHGRIAVQYTVHNPTSALESYTTGAIDGRSVPAAYQRTTVAPRAGSFGVMVSGRGIQLIIPKAARHLTITNLGS